MTTRKAGPKGPAAAKQAAATPGDAIGSRVPFDPFTATFEEAQRLQALAPNALSPDGPLFQFVEARRLEEEKTRILGGTGFDVLAAVAGCARTGLVMPRWLARVFLQRYRQVQLLHVDSWDAESAFGTPYPLNAQLGARRRRRLQRIQVWNLVIEYVKRFPDKPIEPLWEAFARGHTKKTAEAMTVAPDIAEVARQIGCGRSAAQERYREACALIGMDDHAVRAGLAGSQPATSAKVAGRKKPP